jgi:hypothetical protein
MKLARSRVPKSKESVRVRSPFPTFGPAKSPDKAVDLQFKKDVSRVFSSACAALLTLGVSVVSDSRRVAQNCTLLYAKIVRP